MKNLSERQLDVINELKKSNQILVGTGGYSIATINALVKKGLITILETAVNYRIRKGSFTYIIKIN